MLAAKVLFLWIRQKMLNKEDYLVCPKHPFINLKCQFLIYTSLWERRLWFQFFWPVHKASQRNNGGECNIEVEGREKPSQRIRFNRFTQTNVETKNAVDRLDIFWSSDEIKTIKKSKWLLITFYFIQQKKTKKVFKSRNIEKTADLTTRVNTNFPRQFRHIFWGVLSEVPFNRLF